MMNRKNYKTYNIYKNNNKDIDKNSPNTNNSSVFSTVKETIVTGFGLGVGNEVAHRLVSSILGPRKIEVQEKKQECSNELEQYQRCLKLNNCTDELIVYNKCVKSE